MPAPWEAGSPSPARPQSPSRSPEARAPPDGGRARRPPEVPAVVLGAALCPQLQALGRNRDFPRRGFFLLPASPGPPRKAAARSECLFTPPEGGRRQRAAAGAARGEPSVSSAPRSAGERWLLSVTWRAGPLTSAHSQAGTRDATLPAGVRLRCPSGRQREPHCPCPSSETSTLAGHLPGRLGEEGRQRLGAAAPAQRALLRGLAGLWSPEHSAHTAVPRDEAAAPCAGSRPRPRQCPGRPASWPAASAPVPRLCQFFLRAGPGGCACCEMSGFGAALRPGAGRRRLSSLGRLRIQCVAPAA